MHEQDSRFERPAATDILARLEAWGLDRHGRARCPGHNGQDRNLSVKRAGDKVLLKCFSHGCSFKQIMAGLDMDPPPAPDFEPKREAVPERLDPEHSAFPYHDADGRVVVTLRRIDCWERRAWGDPKLPKRAKDCRRDPPGVKKPDTGWPLYRLPSLLAHPTAPLLIVEGERAAEAAQERVPDGWQATCALGGANEAHNADYRPVEGRKVVVWPDNDSAGLKHAQNVIRHCWEAGGASVAIVPTDDLPPGWDVADG